MVLRSPPVAALMVMAISRAAGAASGTCPTPAAITAELQRLPDTGAIDRLGRSEVTAEGGTLRIVLRDSTGAVLGVREIEAPRDCRQRAAVAAVVLAAWAHVWDSPAVTLSPVGAPAVPRPWRAEVGLEGSVHTDGTGMAPGVTVRAGLRLSGPLSAGVTAGLVGERERELGPGAIGYDLTRAGLGLVYRVDLGPTWIDAGIFPLLVRLGVTPRNLPAAHAVALWAAALEARFRLGLTWRRIMPFVSGSVGRRLVRDRVTLEDVSQQAEVSPWDLNVGIGFAVMFGRGVNQ